MKDLREKADPGVDADRFEDAEGVYVVYSAALYEPDEVSPEGDYPKYGQWLETGDPGDPDDESYLECPQCLARSLVDAVDYDDLGFPMQLEILETELVDEHWTWDGSVEPYDEEEPSV